MFNAQRFLLFAIFLIVSDQSFSQTETSSLLNQGLESNSYGTIYSTIETQCGSVAKDSTVRSRLAQATEIRQCIEQWSGFVIASSSFEQRSGVTQAIAPLLEKAEAKEQEAKAEDEFLGLKWGLGFGYSFSFDDAIDEATIVDGIVRVTSSKEEQPRVLLEFHRYFWCNDSGKDGTQGCGPFVAVAAKDGDVLGGVGLGFMYGRKAKAGDSDGFSIGIGALLDGDVKDLGEGFHANQPPPGTETTVRLESKSRWSAILFVTRTF